ncbi:hypothetical protein [uncultured Roseibium sp.]|uniref:hypothetical protein n=1 Tax=uncultured Roseibium sp. TaxID=1936171 RepID=UPI002629D22D|nr:hypothetical protein [uncultured Roseibium sp.]
MKFWVFAVFVPFLAGCVSDTSVSETKSEKAERICAGEFTPGTVEFSQCVALLKAQSESLADYKKEQEKQKEEEEVISADIAIQICNDFARKAIFKPIERISSSRALGSHRKNVDIDYRIKDESKVVKAYCKMRGREIVDFNLS